MNTTYIGGSVDSRRAEGQRRPDGNISSVCDGQGRVRRNTKIATRDERSSERQNLTWGESEIERLWNGGSGIKNVQDRLMASLDGQNRTGGGKEDGIGKEAGGSEVRGDANVFHETSDGGHGLDVDQNL